MLTCDRSVRAAGVSVHPASMSRVSSMLSSIRRSSAVGLRFLSSSSRWSVGPVGHAVVVRNFISLSGKREGDRIRLQTAREVRAATGCENASVCP